MWQYNKLGNGRSVLTHPIEARGWRNLDDFVHWNISYDLDLRFTRDTRKEYLYFEGQRRLFGLYTQRTVSIEIIKDPSPIMSISYSREKFPIARSAVLYVVSGLRYSQLSCKIRNDPDHKHALGYNSITNVVTDDKPKLPIRSGNFQTA